MIFVCQIFSTCVHSNCLRANRHDTLIFFEVILAVLAWPFAAFLIQSLSMNFLVFYFYFFWVGVGGGGESFSNLNSHLFFRVLFIYYMFGEPLNTLWIFIQHAQLSSTAKEACTTFFTMEISMHCEEKYRKFLGVSICLCEKPRPCYCGMWIFKMFRLKCIVGL